MQTNQIQDLLEQFESACHDYKGIECWSACELQEILGYAKWVNFVKVINKAKASCENSDLSVSDHFVVEKDLKGQTSISNEHIDNNLAVRKMLRERGVKPEALQRQLMSEN